MNSHILKKMSISLISGLALLLGLFACQLDMVPSLSHNASASIYLSLPDYFPANETARAVIGTNGFIYISTHILEDSQNQIYGPYLAKAGQAVRIKEIQPGLYDDFIVFFSPQKLTMETDLIPRSIEGAPDWMRNTDFISQFAASPILNGNWNLNLKGNESIGLVHGVELIAGKTRALSITLLPVIDTWNRQAEVDEDTHSVRAFGYFEESGYFVFSSANLLVNDLALITIYNLDTQLMAFDQSGKLISLNYSYNDNDTVLEVIPKTDTDTVYISVAATGEVDIGFENYGQEGYPIIYHLNQWGNNPENPAHYRPEHLPLILEPAESEWVEFLGWYIDEGLETRIEKIEEGRTGPLELWAEWEASD